MTEKIQYVIKRGKTYSFRMSIPKDLIGHEGLPKGIHVQKSLGTANIGIAKEEALKLAGEWQAIFDRIRAPVQTGGLVSLWDVAEDALVNGHREDLKRFITIYVEPLVEQVENWLSADTFPSLEVMNGILNDLLPSVAISLDADEGATVGDIRNGLIDLLEQTWEVVERINHELYKQDNVIGRRVAINVPAAPTSTNKATADAYGGMTVDELYTEVTASREQKPTTQQRHRERLGSYLQGIGKEWKDDVSEVFTKANLLAYKEQEIQRGIAAQTVRNYFSSLTLFCGYLADNGKLQVNPCAGIQLPKVRTTKFMEEDSKLAYTLEEMKHIYAHVNERIDTARDWRGRLAALCVKTILLSGCRAKEACLMHGMDVDLKAGTWSITDKRPDQEIKNSQSVRTIPLHPALLSDTAWVEAVREAQNDGDRRVFTAHLVDDPTLIAQANYRIFNENVKRPLVEKGLIADGKRKDRHSLRRSMATLMSAAGIEPRVIEMYAGRERQDVGASGLRYDQHTYLEEMREAIAKVDLT